MTEPGDLDARVARDIARFGWHVVLIPPAEGTPGWAHTVGLVERFEGYVAGFEVCNAFSELNDPIEQRRRFEQQMESRARGDEEAHQLD